MKQLSLFVELQEQDSIAAHQEVIGRYEELSALWTGTASAPGGAVMIKDDELFRRYLVSLASLAGTSGVDPAPHFAKITGAPLKRNALLTAAPSPPDAAAPSITEAATATAPPVPQPVLSPSALMTALFSGPAGRGRGGEARVLSAGSFGGALPGTGGVGLNTGASEPIRVIVEEAKSPLAYRIAKFIALTVIYSFLLCQSTHLHPSLL